MATKNEQVIIDVVPDIDLTALAKKYMALKEDLKKLKSSIREELKLEFGVKRPSAKDVNAIARDVITEAKKLEKEQTANELAELRQRINTKHTYRKAEIARIRADRKAEAAEEIREAKDTAKKIRDAYSEAKRNLNYKGTFLDPSSATKEVDQYVKAFKKASAGIFAWTPSQTQAQNQYWKIATENAQREAIKSAKKVGDTYNKALNTKAPIGTLGVQTTSSGAFSSLATKQTYNSASDFKANASMENTARAAVAQSAKLGKQAAHEFNNSFLGSFMSGSSFGHKVGTTMQYMLAGAGIAGGAMAFAGLKDAIVEADKALGMFRGILEMSDNQAKGLQSSIFEIGKTFGGTTQDLNATALALGRAGIAGSELKDSITAVSQMALVSGESLDVVTDLFVSWRTLYPEKPIDELANSMTAAANATKATIPDLATASNYLLTAGSQAGMTADALLAMEASLIQIGKSASTSGTEGRRFFEQMSRGSDEVKKAWFALGINVDTLSAELAKGGVHAEAAMLKFYETIGQKSKSQVQSAVKGIKDVLDVATIQGQYAISQANIGFKEVLEETKKNTNALKDASDTVALTYEKMFERIVVAGKESAVSFENGIVSGFGGGTVDNFNKNIKVFSENASKAAEGIGRIIGVLLKGIDVLIRNINVIGETVLFTGLAYGAVAAVTGISALSTAIVGVTAKQWLLNTAMNANPLGLVVTAAFAAATALEYFGSKTIDALNKIANNNALKNFKKDLDLINLAVGPKAQLEVIKYLELAKIKQLNDSAKKYNEASGWFNATMSDEKKNLLAINKAHAEELKQLRAKKDELKALQKVKTTEQELAIVNVPDLSAGPLSLSDKDSGKATRDAQRIAQDALDAEIQGIREKYATIERNESQINKLTSERKKELEILEAYEKSSATDKAKGIDDWVEKSRKAHVEALDKETALYTEVNKTNLEFIKRANLREAEAADASAITEQEKAYAKYLKDIGDANNKFLDSKDSTQFDADKANAGVSYRKTLNELEYKLLETKNKLNESLDKELIKSFSLTEATSKRITAEIEGEAKLQEIRAQFRNLEDPAGLEEALAKQKILNEMAFNTAVLEEYYDGLNKIVDAMEKMGELSSGLASENFTKNYNGMASAMKSIVKLSKQQAYIDKSRNGLQKAYNAGKVDEETYKSALKDLDNQSFEAQISGYADLSGAMSQMFEEGSKEAAAFKAGQVILSGIQGILAIINAGTSGDGYTAIARMAAMAAVVIPMVASIGGTIKAFSGGSSVSQDEIDAYTKGNTGTGTVLGDEEAQSESISNSLGILSDIAKPEFKLISEMNASLKSIGVKLGGTAANIVQQGGFATGAGAINYTQNAKMVDLYSEWRGKVEGILGNIGTPIGQALVKLSGGLTTKIAQSLFGKGTSYTTIGAGLQFGGQNLQDAINNLVGSSFQTIFTQTDGGLLGSDSSSLFDTYSTLDSYTKSQFQLVLKDLYNVTDTAGEILGESVENSLNSMTINLGKISLMGKSGEEIQKTLESVFSAVGDNMAAIALPALLPFQTIGEGMFETMVRVSSGMEEAGYYIGKLGKNFEEINYKDIIEKQGVVAVEALTQSIINFDTSVYGLNNGVVEIIDNLDATASEIYDTYIALDTLRLQLEYAKATAQSLTADMIKGAGSIDMLSESVTSFIENFTSKDAQFNYQLAEMMKQFDAIGLSMPNTKQGFIDLVGMMDTTTASGQELYGRLIALSQGFSDVADQANEVVGSYLDIFARIDEILNPSGLTTLLSLQQQVIDATIDNAGTVIDRLERARDSEVQTLSEQLNIIKTNVQAFTDLAKSLRERILPTSEEAQTGYRASYNAIVNAIANNLDYSGMTSDFAKSANTYADSIKASATTSEEMAYNTLLLANEVGGLGLSGEATLTTLQSSIDGIGNVFETMIGQLNDTLTIDFDAFLTDNEKYFGEQSLIVNRLTSVDNWMSLLYQAQAQARALDTAHLSIDTFSSGHVLGTQEKVDVSRLSGLTIGTTAFEDLVGDIQGFSNTSDDNNYILQQAGINGTSIGNIGLLQSMQGIADNGALPQDAIDALNWLRYQYMPDAAGIEYINSLNNINTQKTQLQAQANALYADAQYLASLASVNSGDTQMFLATQAIAKTNTANSLINQMNSLQNPVLKTSFGFSAGGYTGDMAVDAIAGVVHGKEYVVNAKTTKDLGLNNSSGVFTNMQEELLDIKLLMVKLVADSGRQLQTQRAIYSQGEVA